MLCCSAAGSIKNGVAHWNSSFNDQTFRAKMCEYYEVRDDQALRLAPLLRVVLLDPNSTDAERAQRRRGDEE